MGASTLTTYDFAIKRRYTPQMIEKLMFSDRPWLAKVGKNTSFGGDTLTVPIIHVAPQGVAAQSLAIAQSNATNLVGKKFLVSIADYFGSVSIGSKVMLASRDNLGAFLTNKTQETDALYEQMSDQIDTHCWGAGGGAIGQIATAGITGNVITLAIPSQIFAFEEGMTLAFSTGDGTGGADAQRVGQCVVASVQREAGTVTVVNIASATGVAAADFIFRYGDFVGNTTTNQIKGIQAYIPSTGVAVPNLFGMVRTSDPTRLAGCRVAAADLIGRNKEEKIKLLGAYMTGRYKMKAPTDGWMHPEDWQDLEILLQSRGIRALEDKSSTFGFRTLEVTMGGASVQIYPNRSTPKGSAFFTRTQNWTLWSMTDLIHTLNGDGLQMLRYATTNDYELRLESFPQLVTNAPGYNGRVPV
jgi:hypothetical protein